ncbi:hypothetical protein LLH03_05660 [bacterium]|nr:hypothetical protein [bacterium]
MPTTFNPVFILALGGTGTQVARLLRDRLAWRYGDPANIPFVRFLFVDTDHNNPDAAGPDGIQINPPGGQIDRMLAHPEEFDHIGLKDWIDMDALKRADKGGFQQGAAGIRMFGRLALLSSQSFQNLWQQISRKVKEILTVTDTDIKDQLGLDPNAEIRVGPARCYVISSSCGGTGSGTFIDVGYILHEILQKEGLDARRLGILAIARQDATSERQFTRNTAASLSELDYYNRSGVIYDAKFPQQGAVKTRAAAFDYCYLVSPSGPKGPLGFSEFLSSVAEYIYVDVIAQTQEAQSRRDDFGPDMAEYDLDGYPLRFLTFGVSSIEFPADVCHKACTYGTIAEFVEAWLQTDGRRIANDGALPLDPGDADKLALNQALGVASTRVEDDPVLEELTQVPEDLADVLGGVRPQDWMNQEIRKLFEGEPDANAFSDLQRRLDQAFSKEGYFTRCVELNLRRLRGGRWLENALLQTLLPVVFDLKRGPRYALGLVRGLQAGLADELKRMDAEIKRPAVGEYTLEDARQAVEAVRRDWLLRVPPLIGFTWINESAARREALKPRVLVCDAYNRRAEQLVIGAKRQLYAELLDPALKALESRLSNLLQYLTAWHNEAGQEYAEILARPLDRRTAMLFSEQVVQLKMDRVMKDVDEGTRDKFYLSLLEPTRTAALREALTATLDRDESRAFTAAYPRDAARGGAIQLRYVEAIVETLRDRYRQHAPAGQPPIIYDERAIERFQDAAVESAGLSAEMGQVVDEAMEMAELNLQHPKYSDLQPVNPRDGWWAFFSGAQAANEWTEFKTQLSNGVNALAGTRGVSAPNPDKWLQEIADPYMVILLRERAAFPSRILRGYDISEREEKIQGSRAVSARVPEMTAFSRTGIRPQPPSERDLREAEQFFLGAVLLNLLQYSQERQEFSVELAQAPGLPRRLLTLSNDFSVTVSDLAYRNETRTILATMLQDKINQLGKEQALAVTSAVKSRIMVTETGEARTHEMAILGLRGLGDAQASNIVRGFEANMGLAPEGQRPADQPHPYADLNLDPAPGRRPGYYCRNRACQVFLGGELQTVPPQCPNCGRSFVPYTA